MAQFGKLDFGELYVRFGNTAAATVTDPGGSGGQGGGSDQLPNVGWAADESVLLETSGTNLITLRASAPHTAPIRVTFNVEGDGTGPGQLTLGVDFAVPQLEATIPAGATTVQVPVLIVNDGDQEVEETARLVIEAAVEVAVTARPALINRPEHTLRVPSNDTVAPIVGFNMDSSSLFEGQTLQKVSVELSKAATSDVVVSLGVDADTSSADPSDYTLPPTVTIPQGQISAPVSLQAASDAFQEGAELLTIEITGATGADVGGISECEITIQDATVTVDPVVGWDQGSFELTEGGSAGGNASVTVGVSVLNASQATFNGDVVLEVRLVSTSTATLPGDFTVTPTAFNLNGGNLTQQVSISAVDDSAVENVESILLELVAISGGTVDSQKRVLLGSIEDNDEPPSDMPTVGFGVASASFEEGDGTQTVPIVLSEPHERDIRLTIELLEAGNAPGNLTRGEDIFWSSDNFTVPAGQTSANMFFSIGEDTLAEPEETCLFRIVTAVEQGGPGTAAPIGQGDFRVTVAASTGTSVEATWSLASETVPEGELSTAKVLIDAALGSPLTIPIARVSGTATPGADYSAPDEVTIPAGSVEAEFNFYALPDSEAENNESVVFEIQATSGLTVGTPGQLSLQIQNSAPVQVPLVGWEVPEFRIDEQTPSGASVDVLLSGPGLDFTVGFDVAVNLVSPTSAQAPGTSGADFDYQPRSVRFEPGQTRRTVTITPVNDSATEGEETITLELVPEAGRANPDPNARVLSGLITDEPLSQALRWASTAAELTRGTTNQTFRLETPYSVSSPVDITIEKVGGQADAEFPSEVTIPAGQSGVDVPISAPSLSTLVGAQAMWLQFQTSDIEVDESADRLTLEVRDAFPNAAPKVAWLRSAETTISQAGANQFLLEFEVTNRDSANLSQAITFDVAATSASGAVAGTDFTLSAPSITIPAGAFHATAVLTVLTDQPIDLQIQNLSSNAEVHPGRTVFEARHLSLNRTSELSGQRIRGLTTSTVEVVVPLIPPRATLPDFSMNGVACDVIPMVKDVEKRLHSLVRIAANIPNDGDASTPGRVSSGTVTLQEGAGGGVPATLQECNLAGLTLEVRPCGVSGAVFEAKPFQAGHPSIRRSRVRRSGNFLRETTTLVEFRRVGSGTSTARADVIWLAEVVRGTRTDARCETLDITVMNSRWSASENQYVMSQVGSGPTYFFEARLNGWDAGGTQDVVLFQERPGQHEKLTDRITLTDTVGDTSSVCQHIGSGSYFTRRMAVFNTAEVTTQTATDIVNRRQKWWVDGPLGFSQGGWLGYAVAPVFKDLTSVGDGFLNVWDSLRTYGAEEEARLRTFVATGNMDETQANGTGAIRQAGWFKPYGWKDIRLQGESDIDQWYYEAPSAGMNVSVLLEGDGCGERHASALYNLDTNEPANMRDVCQFTGGNLPTEFSLEYRTDVYHIPHLRDPNPSNGQPDRTDEKATADLPWNRPEPGTTAPFVYSTAWQELTALKRWGPVAHSHSARQMGSWAAAFWAMDDAVAEMSMRFQALIANCAQSHRPAHTAKPWKRFDFREKSENLHYVRNNMLSPATRGSGGWHEGNYEQARYPTTTRDAMHSMCSVMRGYLLGDDSFRDWMEGNGNDELSYMVTFATVYDWITGGNGVHGANDSQSSDRFRDGTPNFQTRTGGLPHTDKFDIPEKWTGAAIYHQAYGNWGLVMLNDALKRTPGHAWKYDQATKMGDIIDEAIQANRGDVMTVWVASMHNNVGAFGIGSKRMSEEEARAGAGHWHGDADLLAPGGSYYVERRVDHCLMNAGAHYARFGRLDNHVRSIKRQFGTPSQMTDSEALTDAWEFVRSGYRQNSYTNRTVFRAMAAVGVLQKLGVTL